MKRIISFLVAAVILFACLGVSAADTAVVFNLGGGDAGGGDTATVSLFLSVNGGISAAAVNIIYDYKLLKFEGYEKGASLSCDVVSVNDNGFGQVRFSFCDTAGYFRSTGELLRLTFSRLADTPFDAVFYVKNDQKAVFGPTYKEVSYSSVPGTVTFGERTTEKPADFTSSRYTIDTDNLLVRGVSPQTTVDDFISSFDCAVMPTVRGEFISTGDTVTAEVDGFHTAYTVVVEGDLNGNGVLDSSDYIILRRLIVGIMQATPVATFAGDLNGNGSLDSVDYILLRRSLLNVE